MHGLVHVYTGNGKGKTTAAVGLGIRAYGRGFKVLMVQFLKGAETGEIKTIEKLSPNFVLYRGKQAVKFTWSMNREELEEAGMVQHETLDYAKKAAMSDEWDMIILDEVMAAITSGLIPVQEVADLLRSKPERLEVVLTGRNAPAELVNLADYVSEIKEIKHPMRRGIPARKGIES